MSFSNLRLQTRHQNIDWSMSSTLSPRAHANLWDTNRVHRSRHASCKGGHTPKQTRLHRRHSRPVNWPTRSCPFPVHGKRTRIGDRPIRTTQLRIDGLTIGILFTSQISAPTLIADLDSGIRVTLQVMGLPHLEEPTLRASTIVNRPGPLQFPHSSNSPTQSSRSSQMPSLSSSVEHNDSSLMHLTECPSVKSHTLEMLDFPRSRVYDTTHLPR